MLKKHHMMEAQRCVMVLCISCLETLGYPWKVLDAERHAIEAHSIVRKLRLHSAVQSGS